MKVSFSKRLAAYLIDYFIVAFALAIITVGVSSNDKYEKEAASLINSLSKGEITTKEYNDKAKELVYDKQKLDIPINIVGSVIYIGYFIVFGYLNKGQTFGKKVFRLRIKEKDKNPSIKAMIIRSILIYGIISSLYNAIFVNILNKNSFMMGNVAIGYIQSMIFIASVFMVMYRKDGRGLHDLIAGTSVVEEVK